MVNDSSEDEMEFEEELAPEEVIAPSVLAMLDALVFDADSVDVALQDGERHAPTPVLSALAEHYWGCPAALEEAGVQPEVATELCRRASVGGYWLGRRALGTLEASASEYAGIPPEDILDVVASLDIQGFDALLTLDPAEMVTRLLVGADVPADEIASPLLVAFDSAFAIAVVEHDLSSRPRPEPS
jgi:hypothetical protein